MAKGPWVSKRQRRQLLDAVTSHIGSFIDRIHLGDATELAAVAGVALVLVNANDFMTQFHKTDWKVHVGKGFAGYAPITEYFEQAKGVFMLSGKIDTWQEWLVIFSISYLIVHNFGMLVQTTGNILSTLSSLGMKLLPVASSAAKV